MSGLDDVQPSLTQIIAKLIANHNMPRNVCDKCRFQCQETLGVARADADAEVEVETLLCKASCYYALVANNINKCPGLRLPDEFIHDAKRAFIACKESPPVMAVINNKDVNCCGTELLRNYYLTGSLGVIHQ